MPWGKLWITKVEGSNFDLPFYFSFFSKIPNLGHKFDINPNLPTFLHFVCSSI